METTAIGGSDVLGYVYFVLCEKPNLVRISWSLENPDGRFMTHQSGSPVPLKKWRLMRAVFEHEGMLHARFRDEWSHGEWFHLSGRLREYIEHNTVRWAEYFKPTGTRAKPKRSAAEARSQRNSPEFLEFESMCFMLGVDPYGDRAAAKAELDAKVAEGLAKPATGLPAESPLPATPATENVPKKRGRPPKPVALKPARPKRYGPLQALLDAAQKETP